MIRHHLDPKAGLESWKPALARLPDVPWLARYDFLPFEDKLERARLASRVDIAPIDLTGSEVAQLVAFLNALTGTASLKGRLGRPSTVPSGLEVD